MGTVLSWRKTLSFKQQSLQCPGPAWIKVPGGWPLLYPEFIAFISGVAQWAALNPQGLVLASLGGACLALLSQLVMASEVNGRSGKGEASQEEL